MRENKFKMICLVEILVIIIALIFQWRGNLYLKANNIFIFAAISFINTIFLHRNKNNGNMTLKEFNKYATITMAICVISLILYLVIK